jgi:hypothetical protein
MMPVLAAGIAIGVLMLGLQLWVLTVALDMYLAGQGRRIWHLALLSAVVFLGGMLLLRVLRSAPRLRRVTPETTAARTVRRPEPR